MATYNINTDAQEEVRLAFLLARINRQRLAVGQGAITLQQAVNGLFQRCLNTDYNLEVEREREDLKNAYGQATPATKDQVKTLLGL